jgi:hypothetical protein
VGYTAVGVSAGELPGRSAGRGHAASPAGQQFPVVLDRIGQPDQGGQDGLEVGHLSVLEHGSVSFYLTGISRSLTHELIRHRHFSYSQLSQRYVPERDAAMVEPDVIAHDPELHERFLAAAKASRDAYADLLAGLERRFAGEPNATLRRKQARQAARSVLPNATETRIVVTGNYRAWRHFIAMRATEHALPHHPTPSCPAASQCVLPSTHLPLFLSLITVHSDTSSMSPNSDNPARLIPASLTGRPEPLHLALASP